ncbi:MAG TPA: MATE family efflux transporter [Prolixibacteraceae bacterium]|nr:MATE family efflux transporter [Prolixibacteraceae bacterium]HPV19457.1 MATE family efflux transporter [Prolixibacteraceae bacterium]HQH76628.1 MATE family efflux transporter [Prolixibacteraceae bacterium]
MGRNRVPLALGTENVWKLLIQYAIPSVIAMTASSIYHITASAFIGQGVGPLAISGLAITFPLMNLAAAFGSLVGVGAATLMSLRLGQKDYTSANHILGNVFMLNLIFGLSYTLVILVFLDPILFFFGASNETIPYARDYMVVITLGNVVTHLYFGLNALLRATGNPRKSMMATIYSVVINMVLTPLFIYGFKWGIKGAALATVIAQSSMLILQIRFFSDKNNTIRLQRGIFGLKKQIVMDSLSIGMAPFLMNAAASVIVVIINRSLVNYGGDLAVGAYGIINRVAALFVMVVFGLNQGMQPIAGYNFGARQYSRVTSVLKMTIALATVVMSAGFLIAELYPYGVSSLFTRDRELSDIVVPGLRLVMISAPIAGFQMVTSNFFQSIGLAKKAIYLGLTRQIIFLLPCLLILPPLFGVNGVWYSMPAADILSAINAAVLLGMQLRKLNKLKDAETI